MRPLSAGDTPYAASPPAPATLGLTADLISDLVVKTLHRSHGLSGVELAKRLGVGFPDIEPSLELLKQQHHCEVLAGPSLGGPSFRYRLTDSGHRLALAAFDRCQYAGVAPVPLAQYWGYMDALLETKPRPVTAEDVREAFSHLVVSDRILDEIGPAVNAGQSIFIYGPSGNGKTVMAQAIHELVPGSIAIPYALEVDGSIIRFFDPSLHEPVAQPENADDAEGRWDRRWIVCRRPFVTVGGELTLEALSLVYNPRTGTYRAPVQALANGGVLLIDEFGRQRCHPRDLLNWWMVPLESKAEYLTLQSGEKMELPFAALIIFSTNLKPSELVDEAFLRRIHYKIYAESPTEEQFITIFERCCDDRNIPFDRQLVKELLAGFFRKRRIQLRACQPRDLISQALALASYRGEPRGLTRELLDDACLSYFIEDRDTSLTSS